MTGDIDHKEVETSTSSGASLHLDKDAQASHQLYNRFLPLCNNSEKTVEQCKQALAKQLTQARITQIEHDTRLAIIKTLAFPPIASSAKPHGTLLKASASPRFQLPQPSTNAPDQLPSCAKVSLKSGSTRSLSALYGQITQTDSRSDCDKDTGLSAPGPSSP